MSLGMLQAFVNWVKNVTSNLDPVSPKVSKLSDKKQDKKEQEHLEELAEKIKEMPSIDGKALRGLYNPSCTCYRNALIKAFAVSPAFEKALNESDLAQAFVDLSKALKEGGETIQQEDGVLLLFNALLQQHFPQLKKTYNQQDIQELMMPFLEEMLTQPSFKIKEVVERAPESWRYHMWRVWYGLPKDLPIPSLAVKGEAEDQKNIFFKMPIHGKQPFSIEQVFTGRKNMVDVTVNNILASERVSNNKKVELAPLLHKAADSKGNLYPVVVREKVQLEGEPPACLPIYVPRFTEELRKNSARVKFPFFLQVPHTKGIKETYVLRSVAVHRGTARNSGHYVTYIPDPTTFDIKTKMPLEWTEHSDSSVKPCTWNTIKDEIETNGCIFVYDRLTE